MINEAIQNEFGYFGKIPAVGDFIHQVLPQDFVNGFHEWLQLSMAEAREKLDEDFLTYYLNCPSWKFIINPGICGSQAVAGISIPSVDQVGRYFNFTLATVLPTDTNPISYVMANRQGLDAMELLALDILDSDYSKDEVEMKVRETSLQFHAPLTAIGSVESNSDHLQISLDQSLPFADQASTLLSHTIAEKLGDFSMWWYGREGQTMSRMVVCQGMPSHEIYIELLTLGSPPESVERESDYIEKILAGET